MQNTHYNDDLAHNLIFYKSLKQQNFKIENIKKNKLDIFKITDLQEQIFCNRSLDTLYKRLTEEFLTSQYNEYSSTDYRQSLKVS